MLAQDRLLILRVFLGENGDGDAESVVLACPAADQDGAEVSEEPLLLPPERPLLEVDRPANGLGEELPRRGWIEIGPAASDEALDGVAAQADLAVETHALALPGLRLTLSPAASVCLRRLGLPLPCQGGTSHPTHGRFAARRSGAR